MAITLLGLSGCSTSFSDDLDPAQTPTPPVIVESDPDIVTDEEYQATLDRIKANDELEKQLQKNNRTEEQSGDLASDDDETTDPSEDSSGNSPTANRQAADPVALAAYSEISSLDDLSTEAPTDAVVVSPNVSDKLRLRTLDALSAAFSKWDEIVAAPSNYKVFLFTASDASWIEEQMVGYRIGRAGYSTWTDYTNGACSKHAAGASSPEAFVFCFPKESNTYVGNIEAAVTHEYFHSVQRMLDGGGNKSPAWIDEGTADFVEIVLKGGPTAKVQFCGKQGSDHFQNTYGHFRISQLANTWTIDDLTEIYAQLDLNTGNLGHLQVYCMGSLAAQLLIGSYGFDAVIGYYKKVGQGTTWTKAFHNQFGLPVNEFYQDLHAYLKLIY